MVQTQTSVNATANIGAANLTITIQTLDAHVIATYNVARMIITNQIQHFVNAAARINVAH
jgi:hypothetical protein